MAFQSVPDTAQIDVIFTLNGEVVQNSFYAELTGGYALADLQALADAVDLQLLAIWQSDQPSEVSYLRTDVRGLADANDKVATQNLSAYVGTEATQALPNNVTFAIKKGSGLTGRSARGRIFWIGIPEGKITPANENFITSAYAAVLVTNVDAIRLTIATVGVWVPVLVSRIENKVLRDPAITFPWVSTSNVNERVDTHKGRLPKG